MKRNLLGPFIGDVLDRGWLLVELDREMAHFLAGTLAGIREQGSGQRRTTFDYLNLQPVQRHR